MGKAHGQFTHIIEKLFFFLNIIGRVYAKNESLIL